MPDPVLELLRLLAEDASAEELDEQARKLTADDPDHGPAARELALRVRAELDSWRVRLGTKPALNALRPYFLAAGRRRAPVFA